MTMGCASRWLAVPVVLLLLCAPASGARPSANPAAAVAFAAGHSAQLHIVAVATTLRDGTAETATLETAGTARLERVCRDELCGGSWFDGTRRFTFGLNGALFPERDGRPDAEESYAAIASTAFAEPEFLAAGGTVSAIEPSDGDTLRYRVRAPHGSELIAVADARTGRLRAVELPDRTPYRRLTASVFPPLTVYGGRHYDRLVAVSGPLIKPAGPAVTLTEQPELAVLSDRLPVVPCTLSGHQARCLIDTGTNPSAMTLSFAETLGQEPHGALEIDGLATYLTGVVEAGPLALGGARFERLYFAVLPHVRDPEFDVIVGSDVLADIRVAFDVGRHRIGIAASQAVAGSAPIPLEFSQGIPYVTVRLGTRAHSQAMMLDTGDSGTLSVGYDDYRAEGGLFSVLGAASANGASAVTMDAVTGRLAHVEIGGQSADELAIVAVRGQHIGHLGYGFAARCRLLIVDLRQRRLDCPSGPSPELPRKASK